MAELQTLLTPRLQARADQLLAQQQQERTWHGDLPVLLLDRCWLRLQVVTVQRLARTHAVATILGTTNRGNPLRYPVKGLDGQVKEIDRSDELVALFREHRIDDLGEGAAHRHALLAIAKMDIGGVSDFQRTVHGWLAQRPSCE